MKLIKTVTSRKGNKYIVNLTLNDNSYMDFKITDLNNALLLVGSTGFDTKKENYIVKTIQDLILKIEENFSDYESLKSFENWDGIIQ